MRRARVVLTIAVLLAAGASRASDPWADAVVEASPELDASGLYNDPASVIGPPAMTFYDPFVFAQFQVSVITPPFYLDGIGGNKLITTLPAGQFIKVRFDEPVEDHPRDPYGIDLLVFGNALFRGDSGAPVTPTTDMETYDLGDGSILDEPVIVAVSPSGIGTPLTDPAEWYVFDAGPFADSWFPTQAYEWDRQSHTWGVPKDYTLPVDPSVGEADFAGRPAADAIDLYEWSGGGAGFDLAPSGFAAIQYVYLSSAFVGEPGEIDALSDAFPVLGDADRDGALDLADYQPFAPCLTGVGQGPRTVECFWADFDADRDVDLADFARFQAFFGS